MAPLIDFTFILLIFFMVVTQFDRFTPVDVSMRKTPLKTITDPPPAREKEKRKTLRLTIRPDGIFELDGEEIGDIESFTGVLAHHQAPEKEKAQDKPLLLVDPQEEVSVQLLIDTMNALKSLPGFAVRIVMKGDKVTITRPAAPATPAATQAPPPPPFMAPGVGASAAGAPGGATTGGTEQ